MGWGGTPSMALLHMVATRGTPTTAYIQISDWWDLGFFWRMIMLCMMKSSMPLSCPPVPQIKNQSSTTGTSSLCPLPPRSGTDCPGADWWLYLCLGIDLPGVYPSFHQKHAQMLHMQWVEAKHQWATFWHDGWRKSWISPWSNFSVVCHSYHCECCPW